MSKLTKKQTEEAQAIEDQGPGLYDLIDIARAAAMLGHKKRDKFARIKKISG